MPPELHIECAPGTDPEIPQVLTSVGTIPGGLPALIAQPNDNDDLDEGDWDYYDRQQTDLWQQPQYSMESLERPPSLPQQSGDFDFPPSWSNEFIGIRIRILCILMKIRGMMDQEWIVTCHLAATSPPPSGSPLFDRLPPAP